MREIIVDSFAGGGGASTGIEMALGVSPDIAINHDDIALAMHAINHPDTLHLPHNVWKVDPLEVCNGRAVGLLWASPDCKHFSKAKGGKPVEKSIRDLAWVVVRWAKQVKPRVIMLENVEEFQTWGPLGDDNRPCPLRKGEEFKKWSGELKRLGYKVEFRELRACDYGAPTIRKRLFMIARRDGLPIVWPQPTHGDPKSDAVKSGKLLAWRTAAEIIDWSLPCHSIFLTKEEAKAVGVKRPLADATMARIAKGVKRYVIDAKKPFIVSLTHHQVVVPHLMTMRNAQKPFNEADKPSHVVTAGGARLHLVSAFIAKHFGGHETPGWDLRDPLSTVTAQDHHAVVSAGIVNQKGSDQRSADVDAPSPAVTAQGNHVAEVRAFMMKYYGTDQDPQLGEPCHTATVKDRFGLVTVNLNGEPYVIVDIGMRMLAPRELFGAQGFPASYIIERGLCIRTGAEIAITKTHQVSKCGNSVCPPMAAALVKANFEPLEVTRDGVPEFALRAAE